MEIELAIAPDPIPVEIGFTDTAGNLSLLSNQRIYCRLLIGSDPKIHSSIVDTGAPCSIIPHRIWKRFAAEINWLNFTDKPSTRTGVIGGRRFQYRLGAIPVRILGREDFPIFPISELIAQFEQPDPLLPPSETLTHAIVGLQFGPLRNRYLLLAPEQLWASGCRVWLSLRDPRGF